MLNSRVPGTRKAYGVKVFTSCCPDWQLDPVNCPEASVLELLQERLNSRLAYSVLKVYVVAVSAFHFVLPEGSVGRHAFVSRFLWGALMMRPPAQVRVSPWGFLIVFELLSVDPFEPLVSCSDKVLSVTMAFLLESHL